MSESIDLKNQAKNLIQESLTLDWDQKQFWLQKINDMPTELLAKFIKSVKENNDFMNRGFEAALKNDPEQKYLKNLQKTIQTLQKEGHELYDKKIAQSADEELEQQLNQL